MKKLLVVAVAVALALPAMAWGAGLKMGKYEGKITSVLPELNGKAVTADVKVTGTDSIAKVSYSDGTWEEWSWNDKVLNQKEFDKTGKVTQTYGATNAAGKYQVNCKDKVKNVCDADIDSRNYWTINTTPDGFTYEVYGVSKDKKSDTTAKVEKRHAFAFKVVK